MNYYECSFFVFVFALALALALGVKNVKNEGSQANVSISVDKKILIEVIKLTLYSIL